MPMLRTAVCLFFFPMLSLAAASQEGPEEVLKRYTEAS